jgi:serine phosphatase RsbU (regulator of sigma subunit)
MRRRVHAPSVIVLLVCLALTGVVSAVARAVRDDTELRLLRERTNEAAAVLTAAANSVRAPLAGAAAVGELTGGETDAFEAVIGRAIESGQFAGAALVDAADATAVVTVGAPLSLVFDGSERARAATDQSLAAPDLAVIDTLDLPGRRLGYGFTGSAPDGGTRFVVYAESVLPEQRFGAPRPQGAFEQLDYALFLVGGTGEDGADALTDANVLYSSLPALPRGGLDAVSRVAFGDRELALATTTDDVLGGDLTHRLPWLLLVGGVLFAAAAATVTEWLMRRRLDAERLAGDVARLYAEQHARSTTLQRSLVPRRLSVPDGFEVAVRYWPAAAGDEVGGDFYDVFALDDGCWGVTIGDVCGKGIDAAALTALTRHTIRAGARHLDSPAAVLRWTHEAIAADGADTYVTVCFGFLRASRDGWTLDLALGGHPPPLVLRSSGAVEPLGREGTVLGLVEPRLETSHHALGAGDTLLLYTDGLTDAPGGRALRDDEVRDVLAAITSASAEDVAERFDASIRARRPSGGADDTALLVMRVPGPTDTANRLDAVRAGASVQDRDMRTSVGAPAAPVADANTVVSARIGTLP